MQFSTSVVLGAVVAAVNAQAPAAVTATPGQTLKVTVGADGKLAYSPSNIIADVGTKIEFDFFPKVCRPPFHLLQYSDQQKTNRITP